MNPDMAETAEVTESLNAIREGVRALLGQYQLQIESVSDILSMYASITSSEHAFAGFWTNAELRNRVERKARAFAENLSKSGPSFMRRLEMIQQQCVLAVALIRKANDEGMSIK